MCSFEHLTDFFSNDFTLLKESSFVCTDVLSIEADTITYAECFISYYHMYLKVYLYFHEPIHLARIYIKFNDKEIGD